MKTLQQIIILLYIATALTVTACKTDPPAPQKLQNHTLVYGGDFFLGRRLNESLFDAKKQDAIFSGIQSILKQADIALVNAEGVIANDGWFHFKGEPRPFVFRAHPNAVNVIKKAGIDLVTVGNNHTMDYGPAALTEMLDRLHQAGIGYAGAGHNIKDAQTPFYFKTGDTVVAIVGAEMTVSGAIQAKGKRPGVLFYNVYYNDKHVAQTIKSLKKILKQARKHAHVVLFSPHWGENGQTEPSKTNRRLAKEIIAAGYDGIIGHSAHKIHGAELINGKPVLYDAGNVVGDYNGLPGMLFELQYNKKGVTGVTGRVLRLKKNRVEPAKGKYQTQILNTFVERSKQLGTAITIQNGLAHFKCTPGKINGPKKASNPPKRPKVSKIRKAPSYTVLDKLPLTATKVSVKYEEGIELIGYELVVKELSGPKGGQVINLYFKTSEQIKNNYEVYLEAHGTDLKGRQKIEKNKHFAGDWTLPTRLWPKNKIIADRTLFRLRRNSEGTVAFYGGLHKGKKLAKPLSSSIPLKKEHLVPLGNATYKKGGRWLFHYLAKYKKEFEKDLKRKR